MKHNKSALAIALSAVFALSACGGGSSSSSTPTPPQPTNSAPTDITLSNSSVNENEAGATVGQLTATDANSGDTFTFTVEGDMFIVDGAELKLAAEKQVNYEAATSHTVNVTVTDNGGATFTKELTIDVTDMLDTYTFTSASEGKSSVNYTGQIARHALINELNYYIGNDLKDDLDNDATLVTKQDVIDRLNKFFRTTEEQYDNFELKSFGDNAKQKFMTDISSGHKALGGEGGKIAGRDETGQHKTWGHSDLASDAFVGWGTPGDYTPEELVDMFFDQLADNAMTYKSGANRTDVNGNVIPYIYVNEDGTDLKQLIQKFLLMSVAFSQSADDYFGHETDGKGLTTDNVTESVSDDYAYTKLEHQFDEGFGYFGAARDYLEYTDNEIAGKVESDGSNGRIDWNGKHDTDGDGEIDLTSEYNFGNSTNAAKRDRKATVATDFTNDAMTALIAGRNLINANVGSDLTDAQMEELKGYRDQALMAWEKGVAATVVHYINDTRADLELLKDGDDSFVYTDLAKHWSEMKGFALGLQFNPYSPFGGDSAINEERFAKIHEIMGQMPVMTDAAAIETYRESLLEARAIIGEAYEFNAENVANW